MAKSYDRAFLCLYTNKNRNQINACISGSNSEINLILIKFLKKCSPKEQKNIHWKVIV